jgi:hypothetical protein
MATKDVYVFTSKRAPWRRAGLVFESRTKPITIDADKLTEDQLKKLQGDPAITVEKTTVGETPEESAPTPSPTPVIDAASASVLKAETIAAASTADKAAAPEPDASSDAPPPPPAADKASKSTAKS